MFTRGQVADIKTLHPTTLECIDFAFGIKMITDDRVIKLELDGIEIKHQSDVHRYEDGKLGIGGEQQIFFQQKQIAVQIEHFFFQILDLRIQCRHTFIICGRVRTLAVFCRPARGTKQQQRE